MGRNGRQQRLVPYSTSGDAIKKGLESRVVPDHGKFFLLQQSAVVGDNTAIKPFSSFFFALGLEQRALRLLPSASLLI